jgi:predicted ATP-grasp superfamily ATP-dependent carboligase
MPPAMDREAARMTPELDVLLLDGEYRQTLAALRAYARSGLATGALACESQAGWAPSLRSRWCTFRGRVPDFAIDADGYVDAVLRLLDAHPTRMLVPAHDGSIGALRARRAEFERRTALPLAPEPALDIAVSKTRTLGLAARLGIPVPNSIPVNDAADIDSALAEIGFPLVVKPYESWVETAGVGTRLSSEAFQDATSARRRLERVFAVGGRGALVQNWLPGRREAVSLFYADGRFWARLAQVSYREWPVMGGASVLCETIPLATDITSASERLVQAMNLEGCSMVEFRRDQEGRAVLMEVNPRMGGSVQLAINSGINFPKLMYDWKVTGRLEEAGTYRPGKRIRWMAGDIWNIKSVFENQGEPDIPPRGVALRRFIVDSFRFDNKLDVVDFGDMRPAASELNKVVLQHGINRLRSLFFPQFGHRFQRG